MALPTTNDGRVHLAQSMHGGSDLTLTTLSDAQTLARAVDFIVGSSDGSKYGGFETQMRTANPAIHLGIYFRGPCSASDPGFPEAWFMHTDGTGTSSNRLLLNPTTTAEFVMNTLITSPTFSSRAGFIPYHANNEVAATLASTYDLFYLDESDSFPFFSSNTNGTPRVPGSGSPGTAYTWNGANPLKPAQLSMMSTVKAVNPTAVGEANLLSNGASFYGGDYALSDLTGLLDIYQAEAWIGTEKHAPTIYPIDSKWQQTTQMVIDLNAAGLGVHARVGAAGGTTPENDARRLYALATGLICDRGGFWLDPRLDLTNVPEVQKALWATDLGAPITGTQPDSSPSTIAPLTTTTAISVASGVTKVYGRRFTAGVALVCTDDTTSRTVTLDHSDYKNLAGASVGQTVTLAPNTGLVLTRLAAALTIGVTSTSTNAVVQITNSITPTPVPLPDLTRPSAISDLSIDAAASDATHVQLRWTTPNAATGNVLIFRNGALLAGVPPIANAYRDTITSGSAPNYLVATSILTGPAQSPPSNIVAVAVSSPPTDTSLPLVSDTTPVVGQTLTCDGGTWAGTSPITLSYQWQISATGTGSWTNATGAGNATSAYTVASGDLAKFLRCHVTATNSVGSATADTAATSAVASAPSVPVNTTAPIVTGASSPPIVGDILTTDHGSWSNTPTSYAETWQRRNPTTGTITTIAAATSLTYTLAAADVGFQVRSSVIATNGSGASAPAPSAWSATIMGGPPPATPLAAYGFEAITGNTVPDDGPSGNTAFGKQGAIGSPINWSPPTTQSVNLHSLAVTFDGTQLQRIEAPATALNLIRYSLCAWVWLDDTIDTDPVHQRYEVVEKSGCYWMNVRYDTMPTRLVRTGGFFGPSATFSEIDSATAIPRQAWTHLAATYDGAFLRIYLNGVLDRTVAQSGDIAQGATVTGTDEKLIIGAKHRIGGSELLQAPWNGKLDEVAIFNRALTDSEVAAEMQDIFGAPGLIWADISGATSATFTPGTAQVGKLLRAHDTATNTHGTADAYSAATGIVQPLTAQPLPPTVVTAVAQSALQTQTTWSGQSDQGGTISGFQIIRDGTLIATAAASPYTDPTVQPDTTYIYTIATVDQGGQVSAPSQGAAVHTPRIIVGTSVLDSYSRTTTSSVGTSDSGQPGVIDQGAATQYNCDGSQLNVTAIAGNAPIFHYATFETPNPAVEFRYQFDSLATGATQSIAVAFHLADAQNYDRLVITQTLIGHTHLEMDSQTAGVNTVIAGGSSTAITAQIAATWYRVRIEANGGDWAAFVWPDGTSRPVTPTLEATGVTTPNQTGFVGARLQCLAGNTNLATYKIDDFTAAPIGGDTTPPTAPTGLTATAT